MDIKTCEYVEFTELLPEGWGVWFWAKISENAPFSWGDANKTLVTAEDLAEHCADRLEDAAEDEDVPQKDIDAFLDRLVALGETYVDLEN